MRAMRCALVLLGAGLVACRGPVPPVPGEGGPPWIELTSPHFTIWTDADPGRVRALAQRMERLHQLVSGAVFPTAPADGRELAIVLRDDLELRAFSDTEQARPFAREPRFPLWQPMIVLSAAGRPGDLEVAVAHELIHAISFGVVHHQPRWFGEGMATYFETVGLDPGLATAVIGGAPTGRTVRVSHLLPIAELFEWTRATQDETRQYITAWALFWFLSNQHRAELQRYMDLLDAADPEIEQRPDLARRIWDRAFPTMSYGEVDRELRDWLFNGMHREQEFRFATRDRAAIERRLGDADAYAARGLLRGLAGKRDAQARADVAAALAAEPSHVLARLLAVALDHTQVTADQARAMTRAHADDWRAWMLLALAIDAREVDEVRAARAKACELIGENPALSPPPALCPPRGAAAPPP
jgi:hypothetical protein